MKKHCVSLELSKELNELLPDNKENCNFYWHKGNLVFPDSELGTHAIGDWDEYYPAYLASELGEMLKKAEEQYVYKAYKEIFGTTNIGDIIINTLDVNILAKMLIYLLRNNLIKL